jgi:hypothetical protein
MTEKEKLEILLSLLKVGLRPEDVFVEGIIGGVRIGDFDGGRNCNPILRRKFKFPESKGQRYPTVVMGHTVVDNKTLPIVEAATVSEMIWQTEIVQSWIDSQRKIVQLTLFM